MTLDGICVADTFEDCTWTIQEERMQPPGGKEIPRDGGSGGGLWPEYAVRSFYLFPTGVYREDEGGLRDRILDRTLSDGRVVLEIIPSPDGSQIVARLSEAGGQRTELVILDGVTGEVTAEIGPTGPSHVGWTGDGGGVHPRSSATRGRPSRAGRSTCGAPS
jgi:hypothetical protein